MYNTENNFLMAEEDELDELFYDDENESSLGISEEEFFTEGDFDDENIFDDEELDDEEIFETDLAYLDDDVALVKLTDKINLETRRMNESEAVEYMEDQMAEFWPALAAALPTIIQLAPQAVSAISSLGKKDPKAGQKPAQAPPAPVPITSSPAAPGPQPVMNDANSMQVLKLLTELIQSPKILELLSGMQSGKAPTVTANNGQQINSSNLLGVISSLSGALAGGAAQKNTESFFPEYTMSNEGTFLIDPQNAVQEAELILDLIN
jgi:hypothetical protein